ncbi:protein NUCLEOLAR FACTOR 1 isoform X2 [Ziziphus jujuba]|uniref:Protein NUCLEOLAR FACTOR 1 isoform X2 n=1 Tax=Ziziphus jujuba TaxID=326968 RepID=A0A6P6GLF5_ZIZJJ|nr:protein NUCLEOLAR FACTOR 1 isoform X2 [Ziziphus jujuba]
MGKKSKSKRELKRPKKIEKSCAIEHGTKYDHAPEENIVHCPSPSSSGDPEFGLEREPYEGESAYNKLLMMLGSSNKSVADACKKRQRQEEGKSDSEEDEDNGDVSSSMSEEVDEVEEGAETEQDKETSDLDEEHDSGTDDEATAEASVDGSSFHMHLEHGISEIEADNLSKKKWKYKWELPAIGMPNCKWKGTGECFMKDVNSNAEYDLKSKLYKHWMDTYKKSGGSDFHSSKQRLFFTLCNSYRDILHFNKKPFYLKGLGEDSSIMDAYIMHSLNHVFKTADLVKKNDAKLTKYEEKAKEEIITSDSFLDHGFTRPKILILLPFASIALRLVKRLVQLTPSGHKVNVEHMDRFSTEFGTEEIENGDRDENNSSKDGQDFGKLKPHKSSKPADFEALFGGNNNDDFMFGIKFTRRSIKLYSDFYSSDIIVASAVGLLSKIGAADKNKEKDVDYLSSIEVLIIDYADVIAMQNWDFLKAVVERLNHVPSKQHGTDIMRIRQWYLNGYARFYRQSIILGSYLNPDMNSLFKLHCLNYQGKVKLECEYKGVLPKVLLQVQQVYVRFDADSIENIDNARLEYFTKKVFPKIKTSIQGGVMIFVSSYFEFVRLRGFLKSQEASFCLLPEYAKPSDISRARVWFFEGKRKIMLYTERMHFYHRYKIRGIRNLIFYSLPERKDFYLEMVHMLEGSNDMTSTALFSCFDLPRLERIVGTANAKRMVKSDKEAFVFC